jgi:hypothetical protein
MVDKQIGQRMNSITAVDCVTDNLDVDFFNDTSFTVKNTADRTENKTHKIELTK